MHQHDVNCLLQVPRFGKPPRDASTGTTVISKLEFKALEDLIMCLGRGRAQDVADYVRFCP